jgi:hypothetical protein
MRATSWQLPLQSVHFDSGLHAQPLQGAHADGTGTAPAALGYATAAQLSGELLSDRQIVVFPEPVELGDELLTLAVSNRESVAGTFR